MNKDGYSIFEKYKNKSAKQEIVQEGVTDVLKLRDNQVITEAEALPLQPVKGRYIYFVPSDNKFSAPNASSSGTIVRIDAYPGPQATAMIASQAPNGFAIGSYAGNITPYAGENAPL